MYERFFHLRERPFALSPDPDYLYPSRVHREALSHLQYGIEAQVGFAVITGDIGSGKTTLLQTVLRGLDRQTSVSRIVNTLLDGRDLIEAVMLDFGLDPGERRSKPHLLHELARFLVEQRTAGRLALLVIDEAQNLSLPALEEVRMLSNLETEKSKLIQIVLVGQPNLRRVLAQPELEQLRQRVTVSYHVGPLDAADTAAYVNHRLRRAAIGTAMEFAPNVTDLIHRRAHGVPRMINVIADAILLYGYSEDQRVIDVAVAGAAIGELEESGVLGAPSTSRPPSAVQQAAVAPPIASTALSAEFVERELRLARHERELAEQQRVLLDAYRQFRARVNVESIANTPPPSPPWTPATSRPAPPATAPPRLAPPVGLAPTPTFRSAPPEPNLWTRMGRALLGVSKPVLEE